MKDMLAEAARLRAEGVAFALVTVVRTAGSTPRHVGAKMIVVEGGALIGTVGGGRWEQEVGTVAAAALAARTPRLLKIHLTHELAMCCGGEMEVFIDTQLPAPTLVLFGGGHISAATAPLARRVGFQVIVVDELEEFAEAGRFPDAERFVHSFDPADFGELPLGPRCFCVIATRDHAVDQDLLEALVGRELGFLGVIGSLGKAGRFRKRLEAKGVAEAALARVRMPVGLDIRAETPDEIAVSIVAELIAVKNAKLPPAKADE